MQPRKFSPILIASIVATAVIAAAAWYVFAPEKSEEQNTTTDESTQGLEVVRPISASDHIQGNPNAPLVFVIYSDFGCPFCKDYHRTMGFILDTYGKDSQVAWVFRHMPIIQLHSEAATYALASECVAQDAGNSAFWTFADELFEATDQAVTLDQQKLLELVDNAGVSRERFVDCMRDGDLMRDVEDDFKEAILAGAEGTPFTVVLSPKQRFTIKGVQPYRAMAAAIESVLPVLGADTITPPSVNHQSNLMFNDEQLFLNQEEGFLDEDSAENN